eukprot:m.252159 g.252159  ORF g.252159 m.252159 type:complete len:475 (-) comp17637_c0_seq1:33-1457(-)
MAATLSPEATVLGKAALSDARPPATEGFEYDLCVLGAGSGGVRAARISGNYGARVIVAESDRVGGTCVIRGCVPKKLYVYASRFHDAFEDAKGFGWTVADATFDFSKLKHAKDKELERLEGLYNQGMAKAKVELVPQRATLSGPNTVSFADGRSITAKHILVATGSHPVRPTIPGIELADVSDDIFNWEALPASLVIVGAGYIGVEFANVFVKLGVKVTMVMRRETVLPKFDEELRTQLTDAMRSAGIDFRTKAEVRSLEKTRDGLRVSTTAGDDIIAEKVVFAVGRKPNSVGLGLEALGVELDKEGGIVVDEYSRTTVPSIYAVGDVTNRVQLTPAAIREGHAFADTVFGGLSVTADIHPVPTAVFSSPELGTVGLTEAEARKCHDVVIFKTSFRAMKATLSGSNERVFMKIVVEKASDRVLGVHILGEAAGEMIQLVGIAVRMGATKRQFDQTLAVHPTASEELVTMRTPSA